MIRTLRGHNCYVFYMGKLILLLIFEAKYSYLKMPWDVVKKFLRFLINPMFQSFLQFLAYHLEFQRLISYPPGISN